MKQDVSDAVFNNQGRWSDRRKAPLEKPSGQDRPKNNGYCEGRDRVIA